MEKSEIEGECWVPENSSIKLPGILKFSHKYGLILEVQGLRCSLELGQVIKSIEKEEHKHGKEEKIHGEFQYKIAFNLRKVRRTYSNNFKKGKDIY